MRFFKDLKRYYKYVTKSAGAQLKSEVANSYLSWAWWILDPLLFMLVYTFISKIVFQSTVEYFQVFVFIGLTLWTFFDKSITQSITLLRANAGIITKIYVPKQILILQKMFVNGFKMMVSLVLIFILMLLFRAPYTWYILYCIPHFILLFVFTFGACSILMHFGVFVNDLQNVIAVLLRLVFYMSGIFYDISKAIPFPYSSWLVIGNPVALCIQGCRNAFLYQTPPNWKYVSIWMGISIFLTVIGTMLVYRYENSYGKVL